MSRSVFRRQTSKVIVRHVSADNYSVAKSQPPSTKFSIKKGKKCTKKDDISTETKTARGGHEDIQFNVDVERATEQQANFSKERQTKKRTVNEPEEEIEPADALSLTFDYFYKEFEWPDTL